MKLMTLAREGGITQNRRPVGTGAAGEPDGHGV